MKSFSAALLLAVLCYLHVHALSRAGEARKVLLSDAGQGLILPSPLLKITSLEFKGVISDLLFIKALVFVGSTPERKEEKSRKIDRWQWWERVLTASTDLDPYFVDPYLLANGHLTWTAGMIHEANSLLEKGTRFREWDWMLPFLAGFNNFFFLQDNNKAIELLRIASERPGPSEQLLSLASRLAFKEKNLENSVLFLKALVNKTEDRQLKKQHEKRLYALEARLFLQNAVSDYTRRFGRLPTSPTRLVDAGIIDRMPHDPYGGIFSIGSDGLISCTSDQQLLPGRK